MERARVEKALNRMTEYMDTIYGEAGISMDMMAVWDDCGTWKEAWIRTYMEVDVDRLDEASKLWFVEDEDTYQEGYAKLLDQARYCQEVNARLAEIMDELDEEEK